jgi:hypothetical protein
LQLLYSFAVQQRGWALLQLLLASLQFLLACLFVSWWSLDVNDSNSYPARCSAVQQVQHQTQCPFHSAACLDARL